MNSIFAQRHDGVRRRRLHKVRAGQMPAAAAADIAKIGVPVCGAAAAATKSERPAWTERERERESRVRGEDGGGGGDVLDGVGRGHGAVVARRQTRRGLDCAGRGRQKPENACV